MSSLTTGRSSSQITIVEITGESFPSGNVSETEKSSFYLAILKPTLIGNHKAIKREHRVNFCLYFHLKFFFLKTVT